MGEKGGVALLTILVLIYLIGLMAYSVNRMSGMSAVMEHGNKKNEAAYYIAEAGIQNAIWEIKQSSGWLAGFTNKAFGSGSYTVTATLNGDNTTSLISTGTSGTSKKTLQERVTSFPCAPRQDVFTASDTYMDQDNPTDNFWNDRSFVVQTPDGIRTLISFDISIIPAAATISSATLDLYLYSSSDDDTVSIYRITSPWIETQATWNRRITGVNWDTVGGGGDFEATEQWILPSTGNGWKQSTITTLVQKWVNNASLYPNYGMLLKDNTNRDRFRSNEYSQAAERPKLTVDYTPC